MIEIAVELPATINEFTNDFHKCTEVNNSLYHRRENSFQGAGKLSELNEKTSSTMIGIYKNI